jgi:hypothetical protein
MTRNQKIALGCGGAGCLGLIVVAIACGLLYYFYANRSTPYRNYNVNSNRNVNLSSNANSDDDSTNSSSSPSSSSASLSDDDKHKLFHAANVTADAELIRRVNVKIGILEEDFTPGDKFREFATEHIGWTVRNYQWVSEMNSAEKARAYINEHLPR